MAAQHFSTWRRAAFVVLSGPGDAADSRRCEAGLDVGMSFLSLSEPD
jgi:hypothetical protein